MASSKNLLCLLFFFICCLKGLEGCSCRPGYKGYKESCYWFSRFTATFGDASSYCEFLGGQLAVITSKGENDFLKGQAKKTKANQLYVGATDLAKEGTWKWKGGYQSLNFKNWGPKEPNNSGKKEHCMTLLKHHKYRWNDANCDGKHNFICETRS